MIAQGLAAAHGQGLKQVGELLIAFGLSSIVGLERHLRGKTAGLRTQAIVGTASALFLMVSKYGFGDVISPGQVLLDPSRVAGQVVSGVGFLGAGLIITRRGAIRGLTTAAAVWEVSAIGMAAGAGLPLLAGVVTALHFVTVLGYTRVIQWLPGSADDTEFAITYVDGRGVLRDLLAGCTAHAWSITSMALETGPAVVGARSLSDANATSDAPGRRGDSELQPTFVTVSLRLVGHDVDELAVATLGDLPGVVSVGRRRDDDE
jgi:putative Mg2+ transporter-C (MgtC) family protein